MKKPGIGYENYKEFIDKDMYYIDKTMRLRDEIVDEFNRHSYVRDSERLDMAELQRFEELSLPKRRMTHWN